MKNLIYTILLLLPFYFCWSQISMKPYHDLGVQYAEQNDTAIVEFSVMYKELQGQPIGIKGIVACECVSYEYTKFPSSLGFVSFTIKKPIGNFYHTIDCIFTNNEIITLTVLGNVAKQQQQTNNYSTGF